MWSKDSQALKEICRGKKETWFCSQEYRFTFNYPGSENHPRISTSRGSQPSCPYNPAVLGNENIAAVAQAPSDCSSSKDCSLYL